MHRTLPALVLLIALAIAALPGHAERRIALVIGNAAYLHTPPLANPVNDARAMADRLRQLGFELVGGRAFVDLDRAALEQAIRQFGQVLRQGGGVGLVFYSGHGLQVNGTNYLVPVSANIAGPADIPYETVDAELILREIGQAENALNLIILDACRNNPFAARGIRGVSVGLAQVNAPTGTVIAYSTAPGRVAEDGSGRNSPYTAALLAALTEPGLRLEDVFIRVRNQVEQQTSGMQTPWESVSLRGAFYFNPAAPSPAAAPSPPAGGPPPQAQTAAASGSAVVSDREALFWESIRNSSNPADFAAYLAQFPTGTFAALARNRQAALTAAPAPASAPAAPPAVPPGTETPDPRALEAALSAAERRQIQSALQRLGLLQGAADGVFGTETRSAIRAFQQSLAATATGVLTAEQRARLFALTAAPAAAASAPPPAPPPEAAVPPCPADFQQMRGTAARVTCACTTAAIARGTVWGSDIYTDDSSICRAARHAGVVGEAGGTVTAIARPGRQRYAGSTRNGVATQDYGSWHASFVFAGSAARTGPGGGPPLDPCPANFQGQRDRRRPLACLCSAAAAGAGVIWGTEIYTDDSSICLAARHAGVIGPEGGVVAVLSAPGQSSYPGSVRNGVAAQSYGPWSGSFTVHRPRLPQ